MSNSNLQSANLLQLKLSTFCKSFLQTGKELRKNHKWYIFYGAVYQGKRRFKNKIKDFSCFDQILQKEKAITNDTYAMPVIILIVKSNQEVLHAYCIMVKDEKEKLVVSSHLVLTFCYVTKRYCH